MTPATALLPWDCWDYSLSNTALKIPDHNCCLWKQSLASFTCSEYYYFSFFFLNQFNTLISMIHAKWSEMANTHLRRPNHLWLVPVVSAQSMQLTRLIILKTSRQLWLIYDEALVISHRRRKRSPFWAKSPSRNGFPQVILLLFTCTVVINIPCRSLSSIRSRWRASNTFEQCKIIISIGELRSCRKAAPAS